MSRGTYRSLIPEAYCKLEMWPAPDEHVLDAETCFAYRRRKNAVQMYAAGIPYARIREDTGLSMQEVRRLVKRCLVAANNGEIHGFYALIPGWRVAGYVRQAEVRHQLGGGSGGCSGALGQLFDRFPEVKDFIRSKYLPKSERNINEPQIGYQSLHGQFLEELRKLGLTEFDWPFNTTDCGYKSLRVFCKTLINEQPTRWFGARMGEEAARRSSVGSGYHPVFPILRGYGACQLDFHKVDAASVVIFETENGERMRVPVARWHVGFIVEERWGLILGACIALETNPSGDSVLEVVESALRPPTVPSIGIPCVLTVDGKVFPNELLDGLAYQAFAVLKMDNAWSNAANGVVANIISTVGCAVNFGPVRAWWRRSLIERLIGELTRKGLQRLPSTLGSGPADTRRKKPNEQAMNFEITVTDLATVIYACIRSNNETRSEGIQFTSPIKAVENALARPYSGVFRQPIPRADQENLKLLSHTEVATVRGNLKKNVRPYVKLGRWVYTSPTLANSYDLIGHSLVLYCDRRDVQIVHATVLETGEQIGQLYGPRKWADLHISWRARAIINRTGLYLRAHENGASVVSQWSEQKKAAIVRSHSKSDARKRSSKDALELAKVLIDQEKVSGRSKHPIQQEEQEFVSRSASEPSFFRLNHRVKQTPIEFDD